MFGSVNLREPDAIIAILVSFVVAVSIHEFMHAYVAYRLGDTTARDLGRITLNPMSHFEPIGFFGMVMISIGFPFIGWGKPVPVNVNRMSHRFAKRRQTGLALVAVAGPLSNVAQAAIGVIPIQIAIRNDFDLGRLGFFLGYYVSVNILLAAFNMIPIPPLDGHKILMGILPNFWGPVLAPLERYGLPILFLLLFVGGSFGDSIVGSITDPVNSTLQDILYAGLFSRSGV
ncbi:MAG: site-2 protease family protein [Thermomicrobiales bacterium]